MEGFSFLPGTRFRYQDKEYLIRKQIDDDLELTNLSYDNLIEVFSCDELLTAWFENNLSIKSELSSENNVEYFIYDIDLLNEEEKKEANIRYCILEPVINKRVKPKDYKSYIENLPLEQKKCIGSLATFYRYKKRWDETQDKRSLVNSERFRKRKRYTDPKVISIIGNIISPLDKKGRKYTVRDIKIALDAQIKLFNETRNGNEMLKPCEETTVFRIIQDLTKTFDKDKSRHGIVQANLNQNGSTANVEVERPLERVEIDWTPIDLLIVDTVTSKRKRHYLVYAIDVLTGYPLGFYISPTEPKTAAIKQCLLHAILPKVYLHRLYPKLKHDWSAYGVPENIVLDNAKVNESKDLEEVCGFLKIGVQYCPVMTGHHKGKIERALQTINTKLFHKTPGTTYSNPQEKSQYNSDKEACITLGYLYELLYITFIDLIANDYSVSNGGVPQHLWQESLKDTRVHRILPFKKEHLKFLLASGIEYRKITNKGIEIQSQHYISTELMNLADYKKRTKNYEEVRIRCDLSDMRVIYVWDPFNKQYFLVSPTRNSLRKKGIDPNYPVHYEQLHAHSYNNKEAYRNFDKSDLKEVNDNLNKIFSESKLYVRELEKLPDDDRAIKFAEELGVIKAGYEAQLAIDDVSSLELIEEAMTPEKNKSKAAKRKESKVVVTGFPEPKKRYTNYQSIEENEEFIDEINFEVVTKTKLRE